jgi:hypothetical protein
MKITDLNGQVLTVTDLDKALQQAGLFKDFRHTGDEYKEADNRLQQYWSDIHLKLQGLKSPS